MSLASRVKDLESQSKVFERNIREISRTLVATASFVNALVRISGITNEQLQEAIVEASVGSVESQLLRSQGAGASGGNSGLGNGRVSSPPSPGGNQQSSNGQGDAQTPAGPPANGSQPPRNEPVAGGGGPDAESKETASDSEEGSPEAGGNP